ncbi:MAG: hypothetical protein ABIO49_10035 [Dokdonella sp.]
MLRETVALQPTAQGVRLCLAGGKLKMTDASSTDTNEWSGGEAM